MRERTITLGGFSKTYAMTGWRLGYVAAPPAITAAIRALKEIISICAPTPSQWAGVAALNGPQDCVDFFRSTYDERRRALMAALDDCGFSYGHPYGAFYIFANTSSTGLPAFNLAMRLLLEGRILVFPGTAFGEHWKNYMRLSLLQPTPHLLEALDRLRRVAG
jgi:aminotransferase